MRRLAIATGLVLCCARVGTAQVNSADQARKTSGVTVRGWKGRLDPAAEKAGRTLSDVTLEATGNGVHASGGPAATFWNPTHVASGNYRVSATFTQARPPVQPAAYGLFMGGTKLEGDEQNYLYCVVYGTGWFSVRHRFGGELHILVDRRASGAVRKADKGGKASNVVAWTVNSDTVACLVNGTAVASFKRTQLLGEGKLESTDGVYGIRVEQDLDIVVSGLGLIAR